MRSSRTKVKCYTIPNQWHFFISHQCASAVFRSTLHRTMNKLVLISFLAVCLVALAQGDKEPNRRLEVDIRKGGPQERYKASLGKAWESKDGKWSAGTYVQQTKNRYPGGQNIRDAQAGLEIKGEFKG